MKVKFLQHVYTSSPEGLGEGPGFRTVAVSKGITDREVLLLEQLSRYVPPDASREESPKSFPASYSLINFNQKYMCVSRVFYTGRDFRGEPNNYLAHNLLIRLKDFERLRHNAFALFSTPGLFADVPPPARAELPPVEMEVAPADSYQVLAALPRMMEHQVFVSLLNAAIHSFLRNRKLVIVPPSLREGYELVEGLVLCIPRRYRFWFTFSTYQRDPYKKSMWCQLVPRDGDFGFTEHDYDRYWVFNFPDNQFSQVHERLPYVDMLAAYLYANDIESLRRVVELADIFEKHSILDVAAHTVSFISQEYQLLQLGIGNALRDLVKLIEKQGNAHCQHRLMALRLPAYLLAALQAGDMQPVGWLSENAIQAITISDDPNAQVAFQYAMQHAVCALVAQGDAQQAASLLDRLQAVSPDLRAAFIKGLIEPLFQACEKMLALQAQQGLQGGEVQAHLHLMQALCALHTPDMPPSLRPDAWLLEFLFLYRHYGWLGGTWQAFRPLTLGVIRRVADVNRRAESMNTLAQCLAGAGVSDPEVQQPV